MRIVNGSACFIGSGGKLRRRLAKALEAMRHRAWSGYRIDGDEHLGIGSLRETEGAESDVEAVAGYCLGEEDRRTTSIPVHGSIYLHRDRSIVAEMDRLRTEPERLAEALREVDGDYAFVVPKGDEAIFARDPLGVKPLFIGMEAGLLGIASEAKALRAVGLNAESVPPGFVYRASLRGVDRFLIRRITVWDSRDVDLEEAAEAVRQMVERSMERRMRGRRVAIGFSGGVDSSLLALLASRLGDVRLVSVYAAGSRDEAAVKSSARLLGVDLVEVCLSMKDVGRMIGRVASLIERTGAMDIAIGLAVNAAAAAARGEGCDTLILGQLADELFGGYRKYLRAYGEKGVEAAHAMMVNDTQTAYRGNMERDEAAASPYAELRLPYASCDLVEYALSLHPRFKINLESQERKIVLRKAAAGAGVPEEITRRPKKALQFSTNLQKLVRYCKHL